MASRMMLRQLQRQALSSQSPVVTASLRRTQVAVRQAHHWAQQQPSSAPASMHMYRQTNSRWFSSTDEEPKKEEAPPKEGDVAAEEATEEAATEAPPAEEPSKEEQLEAQVKELKDHLMRSLAEAENTRKIASRDVESARQFAIKSFAKSLLDVSDNLTRAMEAVPEEARTDKEGNPILTTLYEGIEMTDKGLLKAFESNGLVKYGVPGEEFDPNKHDALYEYADKEKTPGTIGQVMKPGFMLHKRVLRPAEVGVVKAE
mmetsp:Transcript_23126/g.64303  ORF Transcript_23126/g.64303 Transcript_23126/m.64303 type:complete len:259 (-) Transcript_23126:267-1043(-)